jgi:hypothetical protein
MLDVASHYEALAIWPGESARTASMSRIRFATAQALFEAFPEVSRKVAAAPTEQSPIEFLSGLVAAGKLDEAVAFCSYLLPRREAVWWACGCARELLSDVPQDRGAGLLAAKAWVREPHEAHRRAALDIGTRGDGNCPLTWAALAAGWAGGFLLSGPNKQIPMPPYMTARATRTAILIGALKVKRDERPARLRGCIAEGARLAEHGL